jgi:hypothetical protein
MTSQRADYYGDLQANAALFTRPCTPRTNGKAERFIQTALREWAYARAYHNSDQRSAQMLHWLHATTGIGRMVA